MESAVILQHGHEIMCSREDIKKLEDLDIAYYCGELLKNCPFTSEPENPDEPCGYWHFTADFQDANNDKVDNMCEACDRILGT